MRVENCLIKDIKPVIFYGTISSLTFVFDTAVSGTYTLVIGKDKINRSDPLALCTATLTNGIGTFSLNTKTSNFYNLIRGDIVGYIEVYNDDNTILQDRICLSSRVAVNGLPPEPISYYPSKDQMFAALGTTPLLEFSVDGSTGWHETQTDADRYYRAIPQGIPESWQEPGEAIALVVGPNGTTPTINPDNHHWMIGTTDTGILALGVAGDTPEISEETGNWVIGGVDTGILARGTNGVDGADGGQPPVERVYYDATYGTVCYLDSTNAMPFLGYQAEGWSKIKLWLVTANAAVTGNIVLNVGASRFVVAVGATVAMVELDFATPITGLVTIERDTTDADDTLKDGASTVVTALVVDWRCY